MTLTRRHDTAQGRREAVYSDCETYRYSLTATWEPEGRRLLYIMLNPSKATELANDPTIERCERRARALGFGAFRAVNLFALRETSPERLKAAPLPEGTENMAYIAEGVAWADAVLAAWGVHGAHMGKGDAVCAALAGAGKTLLCLGHTRAGHPRHPLYVSYGTRPIPFAPRAGIGQTAGRSVTAAGGSA